MQGRRTTIAILAGERGAGKTSACRSAALLAAEAGLTVGGLLSPSIRDEAGRPVEIEVEELATGERRLLASRSLALEGPRLAARPAAGDRSDDPALPPFRFSEACLAWALDLLRRDSGSELLILDEVGPLELELGAGFRPFLDELAGDRLPARPGLLLVSARPALAAPLAALLGPSRGPRVLTLDPATRPGLPAAIRDLALESAGPGSSRGKPSRDR